MSTENTCIPCQGSSLPSTPVPAPPDCEGTPCEQVYPAECVAYTGTEQPCYDIQPGDTFGQIFTKIEAKCPYKVEVIQHILELIRDTTVLKTLFCQIACSCNCNTTPPTDCSCNAPTGLTVVMNLTGGTANAVLNWTPGGGINSLVQQVRYKLHSSPTWVAVTLPPAITPGTTTTTITGLQPGKLYDFQVINYCSVDETCYGTSPTVTSAQLSCPTDTLLSAGATYVDVYTAAVGADVTAIKIDILLDGTSTVVATRIVTAPFTSPIHELITGLTADTDYDVRFTVYADTVTKVCDGGGFTTISEDPAPCVALTDPNITVTIELT